MSRCASTTGTARWRSPAAPLTPTTADGTSAVDLPASATAELDELVVEWSADSDDGMLAAVASVSVVGARYFELSDLRRQEGLGNRTTFPTADLAAARDYAEAFIDDYLNVPHVFRYALEVPGRNPVWGPGDTGGYDPASHPPYLAGSPPSANGLYLTRFPATAVIRAGQQRPDIDTADWVIRSDGGIDTADWAGPTGEWPLRVGYSFGHRLPSADLRQAALRLARHEVLSGLSSIPDRAMRMEMGDVTYSLSVAGNERPTGIPDIDSVLWRHRQPEFFAIGV